MDQESETSSVCVLCVFHEMTIYVYLHVFLCVGLVICVCQPVCTSAFVFAVNAR